jgi:hypothetical protein
MLAAGLEEDYSSKVWMGRGGCFSLGFSSACTHFFTLFARPVGRSKIDPTVTSPFYVTNAIFAP